MRRHWQLLEAIAATATVLPVRFGTAMAGDRAVAEEFLAPRHDELLRAARHVRGEGPADGEGHLRRGRAAALDRRGLARRSRAARARARLPEAAGHFERIKLGELVAGRWSRRARSDTARLLGAARAHAVDRAARAGDGHRRRRQRRVPGRARADRRVRPRAGRRRGGAARDASSCACIGPLPPYSFAAEGAARMGLIGALLKLPLAPVAGTVWVAERIQEQAEAEYYDEGAIQAQLREVDAARQRRRDRRGGRGRGRGRAARAAAGGAGAMSERRLARTSSPPAT